MNKTTTHTAKKTSTNIFAFGITLMMALFISSPAISHAATYAYVNSFGKVTYVSADSSTDALVNTSNLATHSGVMLVSSSNTTTTYPTTTTPTTNYQSTGYLYVNEFGTVVRVEANTSGEAFTDSINISDHSGVMTIDTVAESQMQGDDVNGV